GKHGSIDSANRSVTKIVFAPDKAARVTASLTGKSLLCDTLRFGCDGTVLHREVLAFTYGATVLPQMIAISEEQQLQCFHLIHLAGRRAGGGFASEVVQRLSGFADGRGDF